MPKPTEKKCDPAHYKYLPADARGEGRTVPGTMTIKCADRDIKYAGQDIKYVGRDIKYAS
jgi:hypothetical protein